jgi:hypothetical protein
MTFDEWFGGMDKEYDRMELKPVTTSSEHMATVERKKTFMNKLGG